MATTNNPYLYYSQVQSGKLPKPQTATGAVLGGVTAASGATTPNTPNPAAGMIDPGLTSFYRDQQLYGGTTGTTTPKAPTITPGSTPNTTPLQTTLTPVTEPDSPIVSSVTAPTVTAPSMSDQITSMYDDLLASKTAGINSAAENAATTLAKALSSALSEQDAAEFGLSGEYQAAKNRAAAQTDVGKYNFAQKSAAQGIEGGAAMMPELYANMGLQNQLGGLDRSKAEEVAAINRARALLKGNYETDLANIYNQRDLDILAAGGDIDAQKTQALIEQMYRDTDTAETLKAQERQDVLNTLGRYYGKEDEAIASLSGDDDPTNDWIIAYLEAAKADRQRSEAAAKVGTYSGGGGGTSFSTLDNQVQDMMGYAYDSTGQLDPSKAQGVYDYIIAYGGQYAQQLLSKWLPGYQPGSTETAGITSDTGANYDYTTVPGYGRLSWPELQALVESGKVIETYDPATGKYTYRKAG